MFQKASHYDASSKNLSHEEEVETVVGPSVHVEGDFNSAGNILIKGSVAGKVATSKLLTIESGAIVLADVKAGDAVVSGEIRGNARIEEKLELTSTAKILGDVRCKTLVVHAGAILKGKVIMPGLGSSEDEEPKSSSGSRKKTRKGGIVEKKEE